MGHDLVYSREGSKWLLEKSSYRKLRLPIDWLEDATARVGFIVHRGQAGRDWFVSLGRNRTLCKQTFRRGGRSEFINAFSRSTQNARVISE
jgi:hypothetical protein